MERAGPSLPWLPCLCLRRTPGADEPNKRVVANTSEKPALSNPAKKCTVQNDSRVQEKPSAEKGKLIASVEPCATGANRAAKAFDGTQNSIIAAKTFSPGVTTSAAQDTPKSGNSLAPAASTGSKDDCELLSMQVDTTPHTYQTIVKNIILEGLFPAEHNRTTSQETTVGEEVRDSEGRNVSQETEQAAELKARTAVERALIEAEKPEDDKDEKPLQTGGMASQATGESAVGNAEAIPKRASRSARRRNAKKVKQKARQQNAERNTASPEQEDSCCGVEQVAIERDAEKKTGPTTGQKVEQDSHISTMDARKGEYEEESPQVTGAAQDGNADTQARKYRKKSSKAKGKRRHGKTGRR